MLINVLSVSVSSKTSNAGKAYQNAEIAFKNLDSGKVESKNITQYSNVFKAVADAVTGQTYDVAISKDAKGYWQWDSFTPSTAAPAAKAPVGNPVPKSNYETSEERAKRQVYIIKQSSLANAIETLSIGAKTPPDVNSVLNLAQTYTDWVLGSDVKPDAPDLFDQPSDLPF